MAGLVAAKEDNNVCSVGVAYNAKVGMMRMYSGSGGTQTDVVKARSLTYKNKNVGVYVFGSGTT